MEIIRHPAAATLVADLTLAQVADHFKCNLHVTYPAQGRVRVYLEGSSNPDDDETVMAKNKSTGAYEYAYAVASSEEDAIAELKKLLSHTKVNLNYLDAEDALVTSNVV